MYTLGPRFLLLSTFGGYGKGPGQLDISRSGDGVSGWMCFTPSVNTLLVRLALLACVMTPQLFLTLPSMWPHWATLGRLGGCRSPRYPCAASWESVNTCG